MPSRPASEAELVVDIEYGQPYIYGSSPYDVAPEDPAMPVCGEDGPPAVVKKSPSIAERFQVGGGSGAGSDATLEAPADPWSVVGAVGRPGAGKADAGPDDLGAADVAGTDVATGMPAGLG